jgi:hypothetical protein
MVQATIFWSHFKKKNTKITWCGYDTVRKELPSFAATAILPIDVKICKKEHHQLDLYARVAEVNEKKLQGRLLGPERSTASIAA